MTGVAQIARGLARRMEPAGRRTLAKVRRGSRPAGEGRYVLLTWAEANERMRAIDRWERRQAKKPRHRNRGVGHIGVEVYKFLARRAASRRGRLDDLSYEALAQILGFARSAIVAAMARLKAAGWVGWRRQWQATGGAGARGPQVVQTFNFYWISAPIAALIKLGIRLGPAPPPDDHDHAAQAGAAENRGLDFRESSLGQAIAKLGAGVARRETS